MHVLSSIAAMLLALFGYAAAHALSAGKKGVRKPGAFDLAVVAALWAGVIIGRGRTDMRGWLFILASIAAGFVIGLIVSLVRRDSAAEQASVVEPHLEKDLIVKRFRAMRAFLFKIGAFQSQILFGLVFLGILGPAGLAVRAFSDPLRIKKRGRDTHWVPRPEGSADLETSRKQF